MTIPDVGARWDSANLVWGRRCGSGASISQESPFGYTVQSGSLLNEEELRVLFGPGSDWNSDGFEDCSARLAAQLSGLRALLIDSVRVSTGFTTVDCEDIVDATTRFAREFRKPALDKEVSLLSGDRTLRLETAPWGTVAAILPQNAFLSLAVTVLLNGLATGNRVILRTPAGGLRLAGILANICIEAGFSSSSLSIVAAEAKDFIRAWMNSPESTLLHFMGASERGPGLIANSWEAGKPVLIDGTGNAWVYVDSDQDPVEAAKIIWKGSTRYNGETCTSINGAIAHPDVFRAFEEEIRKRLDTCRYGCDINAEVGPLFNAKQAAAMRLITERSDGQEHRAGNDAESVFAPTVVTQPRWDSEMVERGIFAPAVWTAPGTWEDFQRLWVSNKYPLCAAVLSNGRDVIAGATKLSNASRVVVNGDPSVEDPDEPWGAYPASGLNPVGVWWHKYLRTVQVDQPRKN